MLEIKKRVKSLIIFTKILIKDWNLDEIFSVNMLIPIFSQILCLSHYWKNEYNFSPIRVLCPELLIEFKRRIIYFHHDPLWIKPLSHRSLMTANFGLINHASVFKRHSLKASTHPFKRSARPESHRTSFVFWKPKSSAAVVEGENFWLLCLPVYLPIGNPRGKVHGNVTFPCLLLANNFARALACVKSALLRQIFALLLRLLFELFSIAGLSSSAALSDDTLTVSRWRMLPCVP